MNEGRKEGKKGLGRRARIFIDRCPIDSGLVSDQLPDSTTRVNRSISDPWGNPRDVGCRPSDGERLSTIIARASYIYFPGRSFSAIRDGTTEAVLGSFGKVSTHQR